MYLIDNGWAEKNMPVQTHSINPEQELWSPMYNFVLTKSELKMIKHLAKIIDHIFVNKTVHSLLTLNMTSCF